MSTHLELCDLDEEDQAIIRKMEQDDRRGFAAAFYYRICKLEKDHKELKADVAEIKGALDSLLTIFVAIKKGIDTVNNLGKIVKWAAGIAVPILILWAAWQAVKTGTPPIELPHLRGD